MTLTTPYCWDRKKSLVTPHSWLAVLVFGLLTIASVTVHGQTRETLRFSVEAYDRLLERVEPGQSIVSIGDMLFQVEEVKDIRDRLQARLESPIVSFGGFDFTSSKAWSSSVVPYIYDKTMPEASKTLFETAIREWQQVANLNFVQRSSQADYLVIKFTGFTNGAPMNSFVGLQGKAQTLNVAGWGNKIDCAHELGHALGMAHEQCRSDRDLYVRIITTNLTVGLDEVNYAIVPSSINRTDYDYDSLMHYPRNAKAKDPNFPTMLAKSPNEKWTDGKAPDEIGQKSYLSAGDKMAMAAQYGAPLSIEGKIVDAAGNALSGVQVTLSGGATYRGSNPISTDSAGHYAFTGIPQNSGTYTITPSQTGTSFTDASRPVAVDTGSHKAVDFTSVDSAPPDLKIEVPAVSGVYATTPRATGTASDSVGLREIRVALARTSDLVWWNWNENTWGSTVFDWAKNVRVADGRASWGTDLPQLPVGGYQVHVQSVDVSDNASPWRFRHFFMDPEPPVVVITHPAPDTSIHALMQIRGTATDGVGTGIKDGRVYFTLYQDGDFWTGFNWKSNTDAQDPAVLLWADVVNGEWIYNSVPGGGHSDEGELGPDARSGPHSLSVFARDNAGNLSTPKPGVNNAQFTVDHTPPSISITVPGDGAVLTNLTTIGGSATDPKSLQSVRFYLYSFVNGQFWDGNSWGGGGSAILPVSVDLQKSTWTSTANLPSIHSRNPATRLANGSYNIIAFAVDSAGNQTRTDVVVAIEYYPEVIYTAGSYSDQNPNNNNELWDNPANWDAGFVPGLGDIAVIAGGSPLIIGTKTIHGIRFSGGDLRGDQIIIPSGGTFNWSGGTLSSHLMIQGGGRLVITGSSTKSLASGRQIENNGESVWDSAAGESIIHGSGASLFRNNGTITVNGNTRFVYYNNGVAPRGSFQNFGTLTKQGPGELRFTGDYAGWVLTNGAALNIAEGSIIVNNEQTHLGGVISGAGRLVGADTVLYLNSTTVLSGGTVELSSGGTLVGGGTFTGNGTFVWSGGTIAGDITLDSETKGVIEKNPHTIATGARLQNRGAIRWQSGDINTSGNSRLENSGRFDINADVLALYYNNGVSPRGEFENTGLVTVNNGANALFREDYGGWHFNNRGETRVVSGKLTLGGGGVSRDATYNIQNGVIELAPGERHIFGGSINLTGSGRLRVTGGVLTGEQATLVVGEGCTYEHNTGLAEGIFVIKGPGAFEWTGGTLNASIEWASNLQIGISGAAEKNLEAGKILQAGTATWTGAGRIRATGGAELKNTGLFEIQTDAGFIYYNNGVAPRGRVVNAGTIRKTVATGSTSFFDDYGGWDFLNSGLVDIRSGSIDLFNSSTLNHGGTFKGERSIRVVGGTTVITGTNTVEGGTIAFVNGSLTSETGQITGPGTFLWTGGTFSGLLNVSVTNFSIAGGADKALNTRSTIRSSGQAFWSGAGALRFTGASIFENYGTFDVQADTFLFYYNNGVSPRGGFVNAGTFVKSSGTNATAFPDDYGGALFDNRGSLKVQAGALHLGGGGSWEASAVEVAPGAELRLFSGRFNLAGHNSFAGRTRMTGGELALAESTNSVASNSGFNLAGGTLLGKGTFAGPGDLEWSGGAIAADVTIAPESHLALTGDDPKQFLVGTVDNLGRSSWTGKGNFNAQGGTLFNNRGEFTLLSDAAFAYYNNGVAPRGRFHNAGQFRKRGTSGVSIFADGYGGWEFSNVGTLDIESGVLSLTTANFFTNSVIKGAGRVRLDSAYVIFDGTTTLDGGTFELAKGAIDGATTFSGSGVFEWTGGELRGTQTIGPSGRMIISGTQDKYVAGSSALINAGSLTWAGEGAIRGIGGSRVSNSGTFEIRNDSAFIYYNNGVSPVGVVENTGTMRKVGAFGTTDFRQDYGGWRFANAGTLEIRSGTVGIAERYEPAPNGIIKWILSGVEPGTAYGSVSFPTTANLLGTIAVDLANGFAPPPNAKFALVNYPARSSEFSSSTLAGLSPGSAWKLDYQAKRLELSSDTMVVANNGNPSLQAGKFQLSLSGPPGQYAVLLSTTNLVDWFSIATNQPFTGEFQFSDPQATSRYEFYRTVIVP